ncbi:MAG: exo-alpha-sialidase [Deltaproteobacteria bacterium]|nr:MAG: exo-alpha-sialidase [Deltaproteobacteria bacterium]
MSFLACGDGGEDAGWRSSDLRLDGTGAADAFDAASVRICRSTGEDVFVVWEDDRTGVPAIWLQHSPDGGQSWREAPVRVNRGEAAATRPDVACIGQNVFVVWEDLRDGELDNKNIYFNRSGTAGESWSGSDRRLNPDPDGRAMSLMPQIVAKGWEIHVVWSDNRGGTFDIFSSSSDDGGANFTEPQRVNSNPPGSAFSAFPAVATDGDGLVVVVWEDARDGLNDIYVAISSDKGVSYSSDVRLDTGDSPGFANSFRPQVALDDGEIYVVWQDERSGGDRDIYFNYSGDSGMTWLESSLQVESNGPGSSDSASPAVALSAGVGHVVWQDRRAGGFDIFYRSFIEGHPRPLDVERNGGEARDAEFRLNLGDRAGANNSLEAVVVAQGENVAVLWEDHRFDGVTTGGTPQGFNEVYYNFSSQAGLTWEPVDLRLDSFCAGRKYVSDLGAVLHGDSVLATWVDGRRGFANIMFSRRPLGEEGEPPPACN